jgi:RNA polymerase sigma factor (sigma-70 family)
MNTSTSDFDLVYAWKTNKSNKAFEILYKRYTPLIYKVYTKYFSKFKDYLAFEDFKQEACFCFIDAMDYVKFSIIYDKNSWKIYLILYYYLRTKARLLQYKIAKQAFNLYIEDDFDIENNTLIEEDNSIKILMDEIYAKLPSELKELFILLFIEDNSIRQVSSQIGMSVPSVYRKRIEIQNFVKKFFG